MPYIPRKKQDYFFSFSFMRKNKEKRWNLPFTSILTIRGWVKDTVNGKYDLSFGVWGKLDNYLFPIVGFCRFTVDTNNYVSEGCELVDIISNFPELRELTDIPRQNLDINGGDVNNPSEIQYYNIDTHSDVDDWITNQGLTIFFGFVSRYSWDESLDDFSSYRVMLKYIPFFDWACVKAVNKQTLSEMMNNYNSNVVYEQINQVVLESPNPYGITPIGVNKLHQNWIDENKLNNDVSQDIISESDENQNDVTDIDTSDFKAGQGTRLWNVGNILINIPYYCTIDGPLTGRLWNKYPDLDHKYVIIRHKELSYPSYFAFSTQYRAQYKDTKERLQLARVSWFESKMRQQGAIKGIYIPTFLGVPQMGNFETLTLTTTLTNWDDLSVKQKARMMGLEGFHYPDVDLLSIIMRVLQSPSGYSGGGEVLTAYV